MPNAKTTWKWGASLRAEAECRLEECGDILGRHVGLDIVDGSEDVAAVGGESFDIAPCFFGDLLWCSVGEGGLRVTGTAPEDELVTELAFEDGGVHADGAGLNGIQAIDTHLDDDGEERQDGAVGVEQDFPGGVGVDPVEAFLVGRGNEVAEHFWREEGGILGAEIVADLEDVDLVPDGGVELLEMIEPGIDEFAIELSYVSGFGREGDHPVFEPAGAEAVEEFVGWAEGGDDGFVGIVEEGVGLLVVVVEDFGGEPGWFPGVEVGVSGSGVLFQAIEVEAIVGHAGHGPVVAEEDEAAVGFLHWMVFAGNLDGGAIEESGGFPVTVGDAKGDVGAVEADAVGAETVGDGLVDFGEHLEEVEDPGWFGGGEVEVLAEEVVGDDSDAGLAGAAEVNGDPVGGLVVEGSEDAFAGGHGLLHSSHVDGGGARGRATRCSLRAGAEG